MTVDKIPIVDFIVGIEKACKFLQPSSEESTSLRAECTKILRAAQPPKSNISKGERAALTALQKDENIIVLPADKGRATVVMDKLAYHQKAQDLLKDTNTYMPLKRDPTPKYSKQLISILQQLKDCNAISQPKYRQLYPTTAVIPKFYGLPKVHKTTVPLRPIVASIGSITYQTSRLVADILAPLVGKTKYHLKNSQDMVNKLKDLRISEEECLVSYDVTALFT